MESAQIVMGEKQINRTFRDASLVQIRSYGNGYVGRIEGIAQDIVYEGKTVGECEQRFREAVSGYKKG